MSDRKFHPELGSGIKSPKPVSIQDSSTSGHISFLKGLLAMSPVIQPDGCNPGCIVLRDQDYEYVVHNAETDEAGNLVAYFWGHYFRKDEPDALGRAMRAFIDKAIRWHGLDCHNNGNWKAD